MNRNTTVSFAPDASDEEHEIEAEESELNQVEETQDESETVSLFF